MKVKTQSGMVQTEDLKENVGKHKNTEHDAETLVSWSAKNFKA